MTIQECHQSLGGNFAEVQQRLPSDRLIKRFITKFLDDGSYAELSRAMGSDQREQAFRATHTLKGVCANLSFTKLLASVSALTELLRQESDTIPESAAAALADVTRDYSQTVNAIRAYLESEG